MAAFSLSRFPNLHTVWVTCPQCQNEQKERGFVLVDKVQCWPTGSDKEAQFKHLMKLKDILIWLLKFNHRGGRNFLAFPGSGSRDMPQA